MNKVLRVSAAAIKPSAINVLMNGCPKLDLTEEKKLHDLFIAYFDAFKPPCNLQDAKEKRRLLVEGIVDAGFNTEKKVMKVFHLLWNHLKNGSPCPPWQEFEVALGDEIETALKKPKRKAS